MTYMKNLFYFLILFVNISTFGQFVQDSSKTCKYWMPFSNESFELSWTGKCKNGFPNGTGTLVIGSPDYKALEYTGEIKNGKFTGQGQLEQWQTKYEGNFTNGHLLNLNSDLLNHIERTTINQIDSTNIFISFEEKNDLFYYSLIPKEKISSVLVLFPSLWERPELVFSNNVELCELAFENNIAIIVPSININMCLTDPSITFINNVFQDAIDKYNLPKDKFILGGFSLGGLNSLRYTELCFQNPLKTVIKPQMVFGVDPPINLIALYNTEQRTLKNNPNSYEAKTVIKKLETLTGGTPLTQKEKFEYFSVHTNSNTNAETLEDIPLRIYCDPDVNWWMENANSSYIDLNAVDQTALILYLNNLGNDKAEFINQFGKGYRLNGKRSPHSWSLLEAEDCISWIIKNLN